MSSPLLSASSVVEKKIQPLQLISLGDSLKMSACTHQDPEEF